MKRLALLLLPIAGLTQDAPSDDCDALRLEAAAYSLAFLQGVRAARNVSEMEIAAIRAELDEYRYRLAAAGRAISYPGSSCAAYAAPSSL